MPDLKPGTDPSLGGSGSGFSLQTLYRWCEGAPRRALLLIGLLFFLPGFFTLPPLDRDESRFAQATKQMLETRDFVEIRFQDEARNKKPVGIYWLQALPASLLSGPDHNRIWAYRLPSLAAALLAMLLTFEIGRHLFDRRSGLVGALLLGSSTLLVVESGIAKTDAALLAATLWALLVVARVYMTSKDESDAPPSALFVHGFWVALGLGILLKGPVILMTLGLTVVTLSIWERSFAWLKGLRPLSGLPLMLLITLPWFLAINQATDGAFFQEALGKDFGGKLVSGQESHGAPPGLYLALLWLTFWPATLALVPTGFWAWRERSLPAVRFLVSWLLPSWIVMELIPTKLPHYTLPLYPALALLIGAAIMRVVGATSLEGRSVLTRSLAGRIGLFLWLLPALLLAGLISFVPTNFGAALSPTLVIASLLAGLLSLSVALFFWRGRLLQATLIASLTGLFVFAALFEGTLRETTALRLSPQLKASLDAAGLKDPDTIGILGYSEPSFIFLTGTKTHLVKGKDAVSFLTGAPGRTLLVEVRKDGAFQEALAAQGLKVVALGDVKGFNYSKGNDVTLTLYQLASSQPAPATAEQP